MKPPESVNVNQAIPKGELMRQMGFPCRTTWNKALRPIAHLLNKQRKYYYPGEVKIIVAFFNQLKDESSAPKHEK